MQKIRFRAATDMTNIAFLLIGLALGLFAAAMVLALFLAHPVPGQSLPSVRREPPAMPSVVVEQGSIEYRFLGGVTGEEQA